MARSSAAHRALILAGTAEARTVVGIARFLPRLELVVSYAGATREQEPLGHPPPESVASLIRIVDAHRAAPPERPLARTAAGLIASLTAPPPGAPMAPVSKRIGGFGGASGLAAWLRTDRVGAVIDATHPFAAQMQANALRACSAEGVPRLRLLRPEWPPRTGWVGVADLGAAAAALPSGARVLLTSGRDWASFAGRTDCRFWLRSIEPVPLPDHIEPIVARPPFSRSQERALLQRLGATHLVAKNSGGDAAKLDAADALGLAVLMVARPAPPPGPTVATAEEALLWLVGVLDRGDPLAER
jgi:precorrin-6A/cobalt-precorrin-6A reductase